MFRPALPDMARRTPVRHENDRQSRGFRWRKKAWINRRDAEAVAAQGVEANGGRYSGMLTAVVFRKSVMRRRGIPNPNRRE